MKKFFVLLALLTLSAPAFAFNDLTQTQTGTVTGTNTSTNANTNTLVGGTSVNLSGGNKQVTNINEAEIPNKVKIFQAPGIGIGAAEASAPCRIAVGGGFTMLYGGLLGNGSFNDEECQSRENARILSSVGEDVMAVAVLCGQKAIASANPTRCDKVRAAAGVKPDSKTAAKQPVTYGRR